MCPNTTIQNPAVVELPTGQTARQNRGAVQFQQRKATCSVASGKAAPSSHRRSGVPLQPRRDTKLCHWQVPTRAVGRKISYSAGSSATAALPTAAELAALHRTEALCATALHMLLFSACIDPLTWASSSFQTAIVLVERLILQRLQRLQSLDLESSIVLNTTTASAEKCKLRVK